MPKYPAGLQDPRYPYDPPPDSCDFLGPTLVTRAAWANGEAGIGMDFDLRLTRGWYAPCRVRATSLERDDCLLRCHQLTRWCCGRQIELEVPHALNHVPPVVHAVIRDDGNALSQPKNLIASTHTGA